MNIITKGEQSKLGNGNCQTRTGYRSVAISQNGEIKPVAFAVYHGLIPERATFQVLEPGDLIFLQQWNSSISSEDVYVFTGKPVKLPIGEAASLWKFCPKELQTWLEEGQGSRQPSFLPAGFGWDGKQTLAIKVKQERIQRFLGSLEETHPVLLQNIKDLALYTSGKHLPTNWKEAEALPATLDNHRVHFTNQSNGLITVNQYDVWLVWHDGGKTEVIYPSPTSGYMGHAHDVYVEPEFDEKFDASPIPLPKGVWRCVKITLHPWRNKDGEGFGVKWSLHHKSKTK